MPMSTPLERVVSGAVERWLARGGRTEWTADALWGEFERFLSEAPPQDRVIFAARIEGFAEAMREQKEKKDG